MKPFISFLRRAVRRSRTVVGLVLVAASIVGVFVLVRVSAPGDVIIVASKFLPAGSIITASDVVPSRIVNRSNDAIVTEDDVIGRRIGVDLGEGEMFTGRVLEPTTTSRIEVAVPLGVEPPSTIDDGTEVDVWAVDSEGVSPPIAVARNAPVISLVASGFGGGTIMTVLVTAIEVDAVLGSLGSARLLVATSGSAP